MRISDTPVSIQEGLIQLQKKERHGETFDWVKVINPNGSMFELGCNYTADKFKVVIPKYRDGVPKPLFYMENGEMVCNGHADSDYYIGGGKFTNGNRLNIQEVGKFFKFIETTDFRTLEWEETIQEHIVTTYTITYSLKSKERNFLLKSMKELGILELNQLFNS